MKPVLYFWLGLVLLLSACGLRAAPTPVPQQPAMEVLPTPRGEVGMEAMRMADVAPSAGMTAASSVERVVIQTVTVQLVVGDVESKMQEIIRLATEMGGYVVFSNIYKVTTPAGQKAPQANLAVRVPAEKLDDALQRIEAGAIEVQNEARHGQDVTREYVDLQARLRNLESAEQQLMAIMQKAETTEDVMNVFNQLVLIREQIEQVRGQIQYYEESAALSEIEIDLIAEETVKPLEIGGWKPKGVARDALQKLIYFLQGFASFLINFFLYYLWVILLAVVLPIWLLYHLVRFAIRWRRKRAVAAPPPQEK